MNLVNFLSKVKAFEAEARRILSRHEASTTRVITIENTYAKLDRLSVRQDDLFRQSLRCIENKLYRAAVVLSWAGFMDFIEEKLGEDGFRRLSKVRPKWRVKMLEDLREVGSDFQIIEALQAVDYCRRSEIKTLKGLLSLRNECAHPSDYFPDLNQALGFISRLLQRIRMFQSRRL